MVVGYPWAGRDWNRAISISGRAAMPGLPGGSGFNFRSVQATSGFIRPGLHGLGMPAPRMHRYTRLGRQWRSMRGLGQGDNVLISDIPGMTTSGGVIGSGGDVLGGAPIDASGATTITNPYASILGITTPGVSARSPVANANTAQGAPWYANLLSSLAKTGSAIASFELNPLYQKSTYIQTPQGQVIATNQPTAGIPGVGLTSSTVTSMLPLLLLGGGFLVVMMMMAKR